MDHSYSAGIDIGSTTLKLVVCDQEGQIRFSGYRRHHAQTLAALRMLLADVRQALGDCTLAAVLTGSAGMGVADAFGFSFVQEVAAAARLIRQRWPDVRTLIEIGGEDSKIAFFDDQFQPDIRMNGNCAGGTGAFIESMALLMDIPLEEFDRLAGQSTRLYPIASRCGVFAKTDIQALLANRVPREDVAASVFHAMALQVISALARGSEVRGKVLLAGGPLTFFPCLRKAFIDLLGIDEKRDIAACDHPELLAAEGAARYPGKPSSPIALEKWLELLEKGTLYRQTEAGARLAPLFRDGDAFKAWEERHQAHAVQKVDLGLLDAEPCFLGIDSGSTTTKIVLIDEQRRIAFHWYAPNGGDAVGTVRNGLNEIHRRCCEAGVAPKILRTAVTGYGEDLVKAAFSLDDGVVETMAHYRAARFFAPDVSFILDIGGQDMKAIHIRDGAVADILVNEACSSGCGSFVETFARSLGYPVADFARLACEANEPFDLGTRCTVFMNSKVKQALREGATVGDISAGLAYSVIKNSLYKVLKLKDPDELGERIVVQGGTFRNPAILRAFELLIGRDVVRPDCAEAMGAYGAALTALQNQQSQPDSLTAFPGIDQKAMETVAANQTFPCAGCENRCTVTQIRFVGGRRYVTGNRCERRFSNGGQACRQGENLFTTRRKLLFERCGDPDGSPILTFGIPRVLNMYENFPFWCTLLRSCGFRVVLSAPSGMEQYEKGIATVMSDSICFPGKVVHGHILDLIEKGVDRIFYPQVLYEDREGPDAENCYNCPVVTGYPDVVKSAIDPEGRYGVPIDSPVVAFRDVTLLKKQLHRFLKKFGIGKRRVDEAVEQGIEEKRELQREMHRQAARVMEQAAERHAFCVVVSGRPYHADPLINHGLPELLAGLGVDVIPGSAIPLAADRGLKGVSVLTQWAYTNRIFGVAKVAAHTPSLQLLQITSFGCGLDAISVDETREIMRAAGKIYTLIKMDEIANLGAVRIRLRSMLDAIRERSETWRPGKEDHDVEGPPGGDVAGRTVLIPWFSPFYSPFIPSVFSSLGCRVELLTPQDRSSVETGLKYVNNDMCYPAVIVIGDIVKAFQSGQYDPGKTTVLLTQTFGQCRASNYLPLAKRALASAGFGTVPVLSLSTDAHLLEADLGINRNSLVKRLALGLIFSDALGRMTLATASRECRAGSAMALQGRYIVEMGRLAGEGNFRPLLNLLREAVHEFNGIPVRDTPIPVVGVLGEIFVKHNEFSNNHIVDWLISQGVEVVVPSLLSFFEQRFVNEEFDQRNYLKRSVRDLVLTRLLERYVRFFVVRVERVMEGFRYYRKNHDLRSLVEETSRATSLVNQAGEGWLLPAEIIGMVKAGVGNIICLQPFGCLANHIIGKGLEKKLKNLYNRLNLLFLDMDPGTSEVNILNRLHFMVLSARERMGTGQGHPPCL